jgi:hypothetical protein
MVFRPPTTGPVHASAVRNLIFGRPGATFRFLAGNASLLITLLDVPGLTLLFVCIAALVAAWHKNLP